MEREAVTKWVEENVHDEVLLADGFEEAFLGLAERSGMALVAAYDRNKCIDILVQRDEMSYDEAREFFEFNTLGAWVGELTPVFLTLA